MKTASIESMAHRALNKAYRKGWSAETLQARFYRCALAAKTDLAANRLVAMDNLSRA
jgi:hypothetical protein